MFIRQHPVHNFFFTGKNVVQRVEAVLDLVLVDLVYAAFVSIIYFLMLVSKCEFQLINLVTLACGGASSENCTYLVQASATSGISNPCTYTICPCSSTICRIRYDFTVSSYC
jgi:hypothetical protein